VLDTRALDPMSRSLSRLPKRWPKCLLVALMTSEQVRPSQAPLEQHWRRVSESRVQEERRALDFQSWNCIRNCPFRSTISGALFNCVIVQCIHGLIQLFVLRSAQFQDSYNSQRLSRVGRFNLEDNQLPDESVRSPHPRAL
jgi:hypothetical protein